MARPLDIRQKEVIDIQTGRRMGTIVDMEFADDGRIRSITVPGPFRFFDIFRGDRGGINIPWDSVQKVGDDVILVSLDGRYTMR